MATVFTGAVSEGLAISMVKSGGAKLVELKVTGMEWEVAAESVPFARMLKLYCPHWLLPTRTVNGTPAAAGVRVAGATEQVGGAPEPQLRFTALLYPLREVRVP